MLGDLTTSLPLLALFAVIAWIALIYSVVAGRPSGPVSAPGRRRYYRPRYEKKAAPDLTDTGQQLLAVTSVSFQRKRLLSFEEYRVFKTIEDELAAVRKGYRAFAQTNLGEILDSPDRNAFRSINSKRVDILVVDGGGWPVVAIEYQGAGHYQGTARFRDTVKREALTKAGIRYVEVFPEESANHIRARIREQLGWRPATPNTSLAVKVG